MVVGTVVEAAMEVVLVEESCIVGLAVFSLASLVSMAVVRQAEAGEAAGSVLRLAFPLFGFGITGFSFCSTLTVGWSVGSLYVSSILTWSRPSPIRHSGLSVNS